MAQLAGDVMARFLTELALCFGMIFISECFFCTEILIWPKFWFWLGTVLAVIWLSVKGRFSRSLLQI